METHVTKVLQVFSSLNMGGAESRMMDVYRHLDPTACTFDFLSMQCENEYYEQEIMAMGGKICKITSPHGRHFFRHFRDLRRVMREGKYDAVHAHTSYHCGIVMLAAKMEHIPIRISHARTTASKRSSLFLKLYMAVGRGLIRAFSTHRLAISANAGEFLFGKGRFEILPNAIDIEKYQSTTDEQKKELRRTLGAKEDDFVIGQIGRFEKMKNHTFTLRWFSEFLKNTENKNALLVFAGDGSMRKAVEAQAAALKIADRCRFLGVRGDIPTLIHAFDVVVMPSLYEGLGGVVLEAQAAGVPVVESDTLPEETDMGLMLVTRCSLQAPLEDWTQAILYAHEKSAPMPADICAAFTRHQFSLNYEMDRLMEIYKGESK